MKHTTGIGLALMLASMVALPSAASAQKKNRERDRIERRDDGRIADRREAERRRQQGRIEDGRGAERTNRGDGPAFCRSGAGHPVHGRQWCRDKGWGLGDGRSEDRRGRDGYDDDGYERRDRDRDGRRDDDGRRYGDERDGPRAGAERWERVNWDDVRFRLSGTAAGRDLNRQQVEALLGSRVMSQLARHAYEQRLSDSFTGSWSEGEGRVLRVFAGRVPLAELTDRNGDRRVDTVYLAFWY